MWVETRAELERAISSRTAMMFFVNRFEPLGQIKSDEWIKVGKERGVPLFNDAAADVPPAGRLSEYVRQRVRPGGILGREGIARARRPRACCWAGPT